MKLKNAIIGLQVFVKNLDSTSAQLYHQGKVGIIAETDRTNTQYRKEFEIKVKFLDGQDDVMNACDARKATLDDAGAVIKVKHFQTIKPEFVALFRQL